MASNPHKLFELARLEGWKLVIDDGAADRPDALGTPQRDELCAQACEGNVVAIRSGLPLDLAFYPVSHEIAEARAGFTGHHQGLWREQTSILARWCRILATTLVLGCAGAAADGAQSCEDERTGWLCDAECRVCTCDGVVEPEPGTIGICIEEWMTEP